MRILRNAFFLALAVSLSTPSISDASTVSTILRYSETYADAAGIFTIEHPSKVSCNFDSPCEIPLTFSLLITPVGSGAYVPKYAIIDYEAIDSAGRILTNYGIWDFVMLDSGKSTTKTLSFAYKGPTQVKFRWSTQNSLKNFSENTSSYGVTEIEGQTQASRDAEIAAAAKAASDKAAADAKIAADKAAADAAATRIREAATQAAKKLTITCVKGKISKRIIGDPPSCPSGFKNNLSTISTFQAYSTCRLYKKDSPIADARLLDGGKTLTLNSVGKYSYTFNALTIVDLACALSVLKAPSYVTSQIDHTRALDGMQKASWGKISAFWTYHPDDGVNISFNSK